MRSAQGIRTKPRSGWHASNWLRKKRDQGARPWGSCARGACLTGRGRCIFVQMRLWGLVWGLSYQADEEGVRVQVYKQTRHMVEKTSSYIIYILWQFPGIGYAHRVFLPNRGSDAHPRCRSVSSCSIDTSCPTTKTLLHTFRRTRRAVSSSPNQKRASGSTLQAVHRVLRALILNMIRLQAWTGHTFVLTVVVPL